MSLSSYYNIQNSSKEDVCLGDYISNKIELKQKNGRKYWHVKEKIYENEMIMIVKPLYYKKDHK